MNRFRFIGLVGALGLLQSQLTSHSLGQEAQVALRTTQLLPSSKQAPSPPSFAANPSKPVGYNTLKWESWYTNPAVRVQLNLNDLQYVIFANGYAQAWSRYNQGLMTIDESLPAPQRIQKEQDLLGRFFQGVHESTDNLFPDMESRLRFYQLFVQYLGFAAFSDSNVQQRLNLNGAQIQKLGQLDAAWNTQMTEWYEQYPAYRDAVTFAFYAGKRDVEYYIESILTPQQRQLWQWMMGDRFDFAPEDYFQQ
jgi:hypothetical protein